MPKQKQQAWLNVEIRPAAPPAVEFNPIDGSYVVGWEDAGLSVMVSEDELRTLVAEAIMAQAQAATPAGGPA